MTLTAIERLAQQHPSEDEGVLFTDEDVKLYADCVDFVRRWFDYLDNIPTSLVEIRERDKEFDEQLPALAQRIEEASK